MGGDFAGRSALFNVAGLTALLVFLYTYYQVARRAKAAPILIGSIAAVVAFLAAVGLLLWLHLPVWAGIALTGAAIPTAWWLFRTISNARIQQRARLGFDVLLFRAGIAALIILAVTGVAGRLGPVLAGLLTAFPQPFSRWF